MTEEHSHEQIAASYPNIVPDYIVKSRDDSLNAALPASVAQVAVPSRKFTKCIRHIEIDRVVYPQKGWKAVKDGYRRLVARQFLVTAEKHPAGWTLVPSICTQHPTNLARPALSNSCAPIRAYPCCVPACGLPRLQPRLPISSG